MRNRGLLVRATIAHLLAAANFNLGTPDKSETGSIFAGFAKYSRGGRNVIFCLAHADL